MPSSQGATLSASSAEELKTQLNFLLKDIYSQLDTALQLDGKGVVITLEFGGLGRDVSGFSGLVRLTGGSAVAVSIGTGLTLTTGNVLQTSSASVQGPATSVVSNIAEWNSLTGAILKDGSLTHNDVADAVSKKHVAATAGTGINVTGQAISVKQQATEAAASAVSSIAVNTGLDTIDRATFNTALTTLVTEINAIKTTLNNVISKLKTAEIIAT